MLIYLEQTEQNFDYNYLYEKTIVIIITIIISNVYDSFWNIFNSKYQINILNF